MDKEVAGLAATEARLREVIRELVAQHASRGKSLSWRLMFEIEDEAMALLQHDAGVDARYLDMMASPTAQRHAETGAPGWQDEIHVIHTALWMIQEAWCHTGAAPASPDRRAHPAKNKTARSTVISNGV